MGRNENQRRTRRSSKRKRKNLSTRSIEEIFQSKFLKKLGQFESMYSFDQVCDPASMFQDTLGLSEFILGEFVEESSDNFMDAMLKRTIKTPAMKTQWMKKIIRSQCRISTKAPTLQCTALAATCASEVRQGVLHPAPARVLMHRQPQTPISCHTRTAMGRIR